MTEDNINFHKETQYLLFASDYYLSDKLTIHSVRVFNIMDLLSQLGGLLGLFISVCSLPMSHINTRFFMAKLIKSMYFIKVDNPSQSLKGRL